jgi:hypothetical protein
MSNDSSVTQVKEFIPESWFDLISRIVPGSLTLAVAFRKHAANQFNIKSLLVAFIAAYAVGFFMEIASSLALQRLPENHWVRNFCTRKFFPWRIPHIKSWKESQEYIQFKQKEKYVNLWGKMDESFSGPTRQTILKMLAELAMVRAFSFYFFLQFLGGSLVLLLQHLPQSCLEAIKSTFTAALIGIVRDFLAIPLIPAFLISLYLIYLWMNHYKNVADRIARLRNVKVPDDTCAA